VTYQAPRHEIPGAASPLNQAVLRGPVRRALVLATFPTALYLSVGEHHEVLPVVASDALMLPTATRLGPPGRSIVWGVEPGEAVTIGRSGIQLPKWRVRLVRQWLPARVRAAPRLAEPALMSELADMLSDQVRTPGLVKQASAVCRAARYGDEGEVARLTCLLLGAGQGLTPSGDDALCAVLLVLSGVGDPAPIALLGKTVADHWLATTSLSASLLDAARWGYALPQVAALVECALVGDLARARQVLGCTLGIGHSSGADLVAGLAGSLRVLAGPRRGPASEAARPAHLSRPVHMLHRAPRPPQTTHTAER
jgi:Protein of unknown function (DUF2877)